MSQTCCRVMTDTTAASVRSTKMGYRRAESEPAQSRTLQDLRSKFENFSSSAEPYTAPEFGLAFGKKPTVTLEDGGNTMKNKPIFNNNNTDLLVKERTKPLAEKSTSKIGKQQRGLRTAAQSRDKLILGETPINRTTCDSGDQAVFGKDKSSKRTHNAGVVNPGRSSTGSLAMPSKPAYPTSFQSSTSVDSVTTKSRRDIVNSQPIVDYVYTSKVDSKLHSAKKFWSKRSEECPPGSSTSMELGADYSKAASLKKPDKSMSLDESTSHRYVRHLSVTSDDSRSVRSTQSLSKSPSQSSVASSLEGSELEYVNVTHRLPRRTNTKPPQNIVARRTQLFERPADDSMSEEHENSKVPEFGLTFKSKDSESLKPSSQAQGRLSQPSASLPKNPPKNSSGSSKNGNDKPAGKGRLSSEVLSNVDKSTGKLVKLSQNSAAESASSSNHGSSNLKPQKVNKTVDSARESTTEGVCGTKTKPLPKVPSGINNNRPRKLDKGQMMFNSKAAGTKSSTGFHRTHTSDLDLKPDHSSSSPPAPPPKPPRTFLQSDLKDSSVTVPESSFDPTAIPRQAGDGQETDNDDGIPSCQGQLNVSMDNRLYTSATPSEPRPYTSLTINDGSGGDDSLYGSENAYDTLGRCSAASSYEHYDTISQSELDSDLSRPPTLPRRPSNLRHSRPLSTSFNHLDVNKTSHSFHSQPKGISPATLTIKETSPTSPSPTRMRVPFKLKYLLPKARRKADDMRKAQSMASLTADSLYDTVEILPPGATLSQEGDDVPIDEAGYAVPDVKVNYMYTFYYVSRDRAFGNVTSM